MSVYTAVLSTNFSHQFTESNLDFNNTVNLELPIFWGVQTGPNFPSRVGYDLSGSGMCQSCYMVGLSHFRSTRRYRAALERPQSSPPSAPDHRPSLSLISTDWLGILTGPLKMREVWITAIWASLWLHLLVLCRKLSLLRSFSVVSGTFWYIIIHSPPIQPHSYLCSFYTDIYFRTHYFILCITSKSVSYIAKTFNRCCLLQAV